MSWDSKEDYSGLEIEDVLICKSSSDGKSGQYLEKLGDDGAIVATQAYGVVGSPSNEFAIAAAKNYEANDIKLGAVKAVGGNKFALAGIHIKTVAGGEPSFSADSVQIEDGASTTSFNYFGVPAFSISPEEIAVDMFSAFTLTGTDCELTACDADATCNVGQHNVNGYPVASDVSQGKVVVNITVNQYGSTSPTLAAASGWEISSPLSCDDPDSDFPTWKATLTKPLPKAKQTTGNT